MLALTKVIKGKATVPMAQQIRYPAVSSNARYLFSIWAFPEERYLDCLKAYFEFSKEHYERTGYRINLLSVGYRILEDQSSLFSYSYDGTVITFDPVSTATSAGTRSCASTTRCAASSAARRCSTRPTCSPAARWTARSATGSATSRSTGGSTTPPTGC